MDGPSPGDDGGKERSLKFNVGFATCCPCSPLFIQCTAQLKYGQLTTGLIEMLNEFGTGLGCHLPAAS